jgi:D-alanine-D-alanine ligase
VRNEKEYGSAIRKALRYDKKILLEENIIGREIECAVLGNHEPRASVAGEVVPVREYYSYEAKYLDDHGASLEIPARLSDELMDKVRELSINTFKTLECEGLGRVDCFVQENGTVIVNEINTIPGFTSISMYPKLWEASGVSYTDLIDRLIRLAMERFDEDQKLQTFYGS